MLLPRENIKSQYSVHSAVLLSYKLKHTKVSHWKEVQCYPHLASQFLGGFCCCCFLLLRFCFYFYYVYMVCECRYLQRPEECSVPGNGVRAVVGSPTWVLGTGLSSSESRMHSRSPSHLTSPLTHSLPSARSLILSTIAKSLSKHMVCLLRICWVIWPKSPVLLLIWFLHHYHTDHSKVFKLLLSW